MRTIQWHHTYPWPRYNWNYKTSGISPVLISWPTSGRQQSMSLLCCSVPTPSTRPLGLVSFSRSSHLPCPGGTRVCHAWVGVLGDTVHSCWWVYFLLLILQDWIKWAHFASLPPIESPANNLVNCHSFCCLRKKIVEWFCDCLWH